jgi:hypothetical protein
VNGRIYSRWTKSGGDHLVADLAIEFGGMLIQLAARRGAETEVRW